MYDLRPEIGRIRHSCVCVCVCVCVDIAAGFITSPCNVRFSALSCGITPWAMFYGYFQTARNLTSGSTQKACFVSVPFKINRRSLCGAKHK
jgi:hypothetical protein